jgi:hypothetical protein
MEMGRVNGAGRLLLSHAGDGRPGRVRVELNLESRERGENDADTA